MTTHQFHLLFKHAQEKKKPLCFFHRALSGLADSHDRDRLQEAMRLPYIDGLEFDVQQTRDGVLIVRHDFTIAYKGQRTWVHDLTLKEIRTLLDSHDCLTLEEVLHALASYTKVIDIEIKQEHLAQKILNLVKKYRCYNNVIFTAIHEPIFDEIRGLDQHVACKYGYPRDRGKNLASQKWTYPIVFLILQYMKYSLPFRVHSMIKRTPTPFMSFYHKVLTKRLVDVLHKHHTYVLGATISLHNDTGEQESERVVRTMIEQRVDLILTDFPHIMEKVLCEKKQ